MKRFFGACCFLIVVNFSTIVLADEATLEQEVFQDVCTEVHKAIKNGGTTLNLLDEAFDSALSRHPQNETLLYFQHQVLKARMAHLAATMKPSLYCSPNIKNVPLETLCSELDGAASSIWRSYDFYFERVEEETKRNPDNNSLEGILQSGKNMAISSAVPLRQAEYKCKRWLERDSS